MAKNWETFYQPEFLEDLEYWVETDRKIALKVIALMKEIRRDPFKGTAKPEQLKYLPGKPWSRRITQEHRIVYLVTTDRIDFLQARYHY
jgi:toxin YoeB